MTDRELMQQALDALNNSVDLVREDAYNAEKLYGNYPTRQGKVGGLKVLADDHEKAITVLRDRLAQPELTIDGKTVAEFGLTELFEFQEATGCDTAEQFREKQATQQEPVAWVYEWDGRKHLTFTDQRFVEQAHPHFNKSTPLYATPPQRPWVGLTDEELIELSESGLYLWELWKAIEAKLKEKNT